MAIADNLASLCNSARTVSFHNWQRFSTTRLYDCVASYNTFRRMVENLSEENAQDAVQLYRSLFAGFLGDVDILHQDEALADFLTSEGMLLRPDVQQLKYHVASPLIDGLIRMRVIPSLFRNAPVVPIPDIRMNVPDILSILTESLKCFDKDLIQSAYSHSYKSSKVPVDGHRKTAVPRESVYDTELMRILTNWLRISGWSVTGQHTITVDGRHKYSDIVLRKRDNEPIVLELLATGEESFIKDHIDKTPTYMNTLSAVEGWVIHFTCEDNFIPVWQTSAQRQRGVNVVHVIHGKDFKNVTFQMYTSYTHQPTTSQLCI